MTKEQDFKGQTLYRWRLSLKDGHSVVTWAPSSADALARAEARGKVVVNVAPAGPLLSE